ncbi:MAG: phenylalanine--tRNA ligase beta subunit-related protein [Sulfolobales archaeon]|nr:phenylalanine--tRNA ligase beta subunit-related protein [Sulfolobales archaeon]MDW8082818.1 phenylalanine--tRNA ligase beta subunit-related protein [Sulfolobales archaeon]
MKYCSELENLLNLDRSLSSLGVFVVYTVVWTREVRRVGFEREIEELVKHVKSRYTLESIKSDPVFRAYRDFFWRIGVDPTKIRPSSEALIRRCLRDFFPKIGVVVDAGNIASAFTGVPIGLYDMSTSSPPYTLTLSRGGEVFNPIGGRSEVLPGGVPILVDSGGVVMHLYPHRDCVETAIRDSTTEVFVLGAGVPGVEKARVAGAVRKVFEILSSAGWSWCGRVCVKEYSQ